MFKKNFFKVSESSQHFLLEIEALNESTLLLLIKWIEENRSEIQEKVALYGGVFFKGFNLASAADFEAVARAIDPKLCDAVPFDATASNWHTQYTYEVASPSIKKSMFPLSFHNEDSFLPVVPTTIMFFALEPALYGGETLIADSRNVYNSLPERIREKFIGKNIITQLVLPDVLFLLNSRVAKNKQAIEIVGKSYGAHKVTKIGKNMTQFQFEVPAVIKYNSSLIWFNVLHQTSFINMCINTWYAYHYYKKGFFSTLKGCVLINLLLMKKIKSFILRLFTNKKEMHTYFLVDGEKISLRDYVKINLAYWKNTIALPLKRGDFLLLDNRLVAHGRMPYRGKRVLLSCVGSPVITESFTK